MGFRSGLAVSDTPVERSVPGAALLEVENLKVHFPIAKQSFVSKTARVVRAVDGVSFKLRKGKVLGLVGESGCGKTTIARTILKLEKPTGGRILFDGEDIGTQNKKQEFSYRKRVQAVFQDPFSSLNPRMKIGEIVGEPFAIHRPEKGRARIAQDVARLLDICGLPALMAERYPHEMSGGQRQRVGIARALALNAELIVCDEAVSALDVSIQAQIINLLLDLRAEFDLTYLFIGHDLSVIRHLCDEVAVMYMGSIMEKASTDALFDAPAHPYTRALISAVPDPDPFRADVQAQIVLSGEIPSPFSPPSGCPFHSRCPDRVPVCEREKPALADGGEGHARACVHFSPARRSGPSGDIPPSSIHAFHNPRSTSQRETDHE